MEVEQPPDTIDLDAAPLPRETLAQVDVDEETVVYSPETDRTGHLNAMATAIWTCLDGRTTLRVLAEDIAAATGWDRRDVEPELVQVVRGFGRDGLLAGTAPAIAVSATERPATERRSSAFVPLPPGG